MSGVQQGCVLNSALLCSARLDYGECITRTRIQCRIISFHWLWLRRWRHNIFQETWSSLVNYLTLPGSLLDVRNECFLAEYKGADTWNRITWCIDHVDGITVDRVTEFTYLGAKRMSDGYCKRNIMCRMSLAASAMSDLGHLWSQKRFILTTKLRVYQSCVMSICLYGSLTWTILQEDAKWLEAFHTSCQRRILGLRWHDFVSNKEVRTR